MCRHALLHCAKDLTLAIPDPAWPVSTAVWRCGSPHGATACLIAGSGYRRRGHLSGGHSGRIAGDVDHDPGLGEHSE
jgi:hypothetical protein